MTSRGATAAGIAVAALGLVVLGAAFAGERLPALRAWLVAAHFWTGLSLGAAVLLLVHAITGGRWGEALGPPLRAAAGAMPVAALAWIPLLASAEALFPWATKSRDELPSVVVKKLGYLDIGFLQLRTLAVLALFVALAWAAGAWSGRRASIAVAAAGLMAFGLAATVFATDWLLAFEPTFYSTIYPVLHGTGAVAVKLYEWSDEYRHGLVPFLGLEFQYDGPDPHAAALFFRTYFALTGLHAVHLLIGIALVAGAAAFWPRIAAARRGQRASALALYWHFVDVVWVFLFPFFYLLGRAS